MEVNLTPELERKLHELASESGVSPDELVQEAVAGMFDEFADARGMLDRRYDDVKSGNVTLMAGEEAFARLHERIEARRSGRA